VVIGTSWNHRLCNPFWRLYVNGSDGAWIRTTTGVFAIPARRPVLLPPWGDFHGRCSRDVEHLYIHFDVAGMSGAWTREHFRRPLLSPAGSGAWRSALFTGDAGAPSQRLRAQALVCESLAAVLDQAPAATIASLATDSDPADPLAPALRLMDDLQAQRLDIGHLAGLCHLSADHFTKRFKERFGQTPSRHMQERRIARAAEHLLTGHDGIAAIAATAGFSNRYHFTRIFTSRMGCPPARYRRQGRDAS
jgi:AraC-like DNA-binding protein